MITSYVRVGWDVGSNGMIGLRPHHHILHPGGVGWGGGVGVGGDLMEACGAQARQIRGAQATHQPCVCVCACVCVLLHP